MKWFSKKRAYLDWAASAPVHSDAARVYARSLESFGNPSSAHAEGRTAKEALEFARVAVARELQVKPDDIIFTSGATEANNLAIQGVIQNAKKRAQGGKIHVLYLPSAHASTVETIHSLERDGVQASPLPIHDGQMDVKELGTLIRPETVLVSMDFVCSETGTVWNTREVAHELNVGHRKSNIGIRPLLHVDASQAPLEESLERTRLGGDLITLDAAKVGGVRGTGVLAVPRNVPLVPILHGGGQERNLRAGTEPVAGAVAFAVALADAAKGRGAFGARAAAARAKLISRIKDIPNLFVNQGKKGVAHILNISLLGRDTDYLAVLLDEAGFAVSTKSACESDSASGSRAVFALTGDAARAASTLRISWGPETPDRELAQFATALSAAVAFLDEHSA